MSTTLMLVPEEHIEWAVQRGHETPILVERTPGLNPEGAARRLAREFNALAESVGGDEPGWHTVCRVTETPWLRR